MVPISFKCRALIVAFALLASAAFGQGGVRTGDRTDGQGQMMPQDQMQDRTMPPRPGYTRMTTEQVAQELGQWIERDMSLKGGKFLVFDPVTSMPLVLSFNGVTKENVNQASQDGGNWTARVDFATPDGAMRTVYFRLRPVPMPGRERILVTAISLMPVDGGATPTPGTTPMETPMGTPMETPIAPTPEEPPVGTPMDAPIATPTETPVGGTGGGM